jgi:tetratricopeptide (TPR) repeat protein
MAAIQIAAPRYIFSICLFLGLWFSPGGLSMAQTGQNAPDPKDPKQQEFDSKLDMAEAELRKKAWDRATQIVDEVIQRDPKNVRGFLLRGRAAHGKLEFDAAIRDFDLALAQTKRDSVAAAFRAEAYASRSASLYEQGKYLAAIDSAYLGTVEKSDHVESHLNRARAYLPRSEFDKALRSLNRVIQIDPQSAEAYSLRGFVYTAKKNFDQAIKDETKAIELNGKFALAFQRRAEAHFSKKDLPATIKDLEQALSIQPGMPEALCDRAILHSMKKDVAKTLEDLDTAIRSNPRCVKAHVLRAKALQSQGNSDKAMKSLDAAIAAGEDAVAYVARGALHQDKRNYEQSLKDFTRAIEIDAYSIAAYQGRALAFKKLGKDEEGKADLAKAKELTPKPPEKKADKKKKEEPAPPPRFVVKSKAVDPNAMAKVKSAAKEIDRLVAENYATHGVKPNPKTSESQFVRRVYLDIVGTIPTFKQTSRYLDSKDPDKRSKLIDELLDSEGYASHFFNYWADTLRYKDQLNANVRGEPFRQWLKQSLAENKPWNKLVYQMLTAEGRIWENPATGYLQRDPGMQLDIVNNTTRIFLGTRIGCAQCHNHPFDKWTQKEFYEMAAFMYQTQPSTNGSDKRFWESNPNDRLKEQYTKLQQEEEERRQNKFRFEAMIRTNMTIVNDVMDRKIKLPKDYAYDDSKPGTLVQPKTLFGSPAEIKKDEPARRAFARWMVSKDNPRFAKTIANRLWKQLFGVGQIEPVDDMTDETVAENPKLMLFLEEEIKRLNFDMKEYLRVLLNSETYQRQASTEDIPLGEPFHFTGPVLRRMTAEQVWDSFLTLAIEPIDYREPPAELRLQHFKIDLASADATEILDSDRKVAKQDSEKNAQQSKFKYKGELLARASELPSPVPANHFLRMFGQSDRELIAGSSKTGSVPQILVMFNGPISHMFLEKNSTIYNNIVRKASVGGGIRSVFLTVLSREPSESEIAIASEEVNDNGAIGYGNVVWSLVNTREFLFIQ